MRGDVRTMTPMAAPMSNPSVPTRQQLVDEAQARATDAEQSPYPVFLRIARILVRVVYVIVLLIALLLTLAFLLRLAGANPEAGFVQWVERSADRVMDPFRGIFTEHALTDSSVFDPSLLFAAIVYFVLALVLDVGVHWLTRRLRRQEREASYLRVEADRAVQVAVAEQQAMDLAARQAAASAYAAQQAATQQYGVARAAAEDVVAERASLGALAAQPPAPTAGPTFRPPDAP